MATLIPRLMPHDQPASCGYFPQIMKDPEGYVVGDTVENGNQLVRQVISITALRELGQRYASMHTQKQLDDANATIQSLTEQVERLEEELMEQDAALEGVDVLAKRGYVARKAPGRKPKKLAEEA